MSGYACRSVFKHVWISMHGNDETGHHKDGFPLKSARN